MYLNTGASSSRKRSADEAAGPSSSPPKSKITKVIHPFFLKVSEKPQASKGFVWHKKLGGTCLHGVHLDPAPSSKVAAFDLDGTIIKTSSGSPFPKDKDDWMWWRAVVQPKLAALHNEGFAIVMFSNQGSTLKKRIEAWMLKLPLIASQLPDVPFRLFAAQEHDAFRKPMPGMWDEFQKINGVQIDKETSFFVGDAAGRPGDHSDSDRKWALNIQLPFYTPEEYFLGSPPVPFKLKGFDPSAYPNDMPLFTPASTPLVPAAAARPEVVLFVGYPASGKTTLFKRYFEPSGYQHVNQDTLKTRTKCLRAVENFIKNGVSCVVDNTNRDIITRKEYVDLCKRLGVDVRCFKFTAPLPLCWHNNLYRAYCHKPPNPEKSNIIMRSVLPQMAFTSFRAYYEEPTLAEGFIELKQINFRFEGTEEERRRWNMWLEIGKIDWLTN